MLVSADGLNNILVKIGLLRRFTRDIKDTVFIHDREAIGVFLDDHKVEMPLCEVSAKRMSHPVVSAGDVMSIQSVYFLVQFVPPQNH
ncbi:MAG: hypothetical protein WBV95_05065 [Desulfobacterales bacterium]